MSSSAWLHQNRVIADVPRWMARTHSIVISRSFMAREHAALVAYFEPFGLTWGEPPAPPEPVAPTEWYVPTLLVLDRIRHHMGEHYPAALAAFQADPVAYSRLLAAHEISSADAEVAGQITALGLDPAVILRLGDDVEPA